MNTIIATAIMIVISLSILTYVMYTYYPSLTSTMNDVELRKNLQSLVNGEPYELPRILERTLTRTHNVSIVDANGTVLASFNINFTVYCIVESNAGFSESILNNYTGHPLVTTRCIYFTLTIRPRGNMLVITYYKLPKIVPVKSSPTIISTTAYYVEFPAPRSIKVLLDNTEIYSMETNTVVVEALIYKFS